MNADPNIEAVEEVTDPVAEPAEVQPDAAVEAAPVEPAADAAPWFSGVDKLVGTVFTGDVDAKQYGEMLAKMTADDLANMPPAALAAMRAIVEHGKHKEAASSAALAAKESAMAAKEAAIEAKRKQVEQEGAQLAALLTSPEVRKLRETKVPEKPDLTTEAGRKAYYDGLVGQKLNETFAPLLQRAEVVSQQAKWNQIVEAYPEFKNDRPLPELGGKTFLAVVEAELEARHKAGRPTDTETMAGIVRGNIASAQLAARREADRAARAQAAANIQRAGIGGGAPKPKTIPREVIASGKLAQWLRDNPDYVAA